MKKHIILTGALFEEFLDTLRINPVARAAKTVEEACKLIKVDFEYVCDMEGVKLFRQRK